MSRTSLFLLQKKIIQIMPFSPYLAHTETLFINLEMLPLDKLILNRIEIIMYKYTNDMLPSVMQELYKHYTRKTMKFIPMTLAIKIYSELIKVKKD